MPDQLVQVQRYRWGSPSDWHQVRWNGPVFKYVDIEHADAVSQGSTKIGTIWGFRELEGAKRDEGENTIPFSFGPKDVLDANNPRDRALLRSIGLNVDDDFKIEMRGATINYVGQDYYASCFAKYPNLRQLNAEKMQAVFRIDDIRAWVVRICQIFDVLGPCFVQEITYRDRLNYRMVDGIAITSPVVKPVNFMGEQEVRVVWLADQKTPVGKYPSLEVIRRDEVLSSLITRVI